MADPEWFYTEEGQSLGPFSPAQLKELAAQGKIGPETLVWTEGLDGWKALKEVAKPSSPSIMPPASGEPKAQCDYCGLEFAKSRLLSQGAALICAGCQAKMKRIAPSESGPAQDFQYAGFLPRAGAALVDGALLWVINMILESSCSCIAPNPKESLTKVMAFLTIMFLRFLIGAVIGIGYFTYMVGAHEGTLGKILLGLRVIRADGSKLGYPRAFARYWAQVLSVFTLVLGLAIFMLFFDVPVFISMFLIWVLVALYWPIKKNLEFFSDFECRTLHDRMCDTRVVLRAR